LEEIYYGDLDLFIQMELDILMQEIMKMHLLEELLNKELINLLFQESLEAAMELLDV